jgi:hypothetical protein
MKISVDFISVLRYTVYMIKENEMIEQQVLDGLAKAPDAFDYIYECISATHGWVIHDYVSALYNDVAIDHRLHPDDDFEDIINIVLDNLGA